MLTRAQGRLRRDERGWTLLEVLVVVLILSVLLAIAVPSYMHFQGRAQVVTAKANVRVTVPAIEEYFADHGDYAFDRKADGTAAVSVEEALVSYDGALPFTGPGAVTVTSVGGGSSYCISSRAGEGSYWKKDGPDGTVAAAAAGC